MGERGSIFVTENSSMIAPAISVNVKSTTGAGDAMVAALAFGLSQQMSDSDIFEHSGCMCNGESIGRGR